MKCVRTEIKADVMKYEPGKGIEDGHRSYSDVITGGLVSSENLFIEEGPGGVAVVPFVRNRRGCTFIRQGDYVIIDEDGTKHVCGEDKIWSRYRKIEE